LQKRRIILRSLRIVATPYTTISTEYNTPRIFSKFSNSNSSVQVQIEPKSHFGFVPRDTEEFEFLDSVDFGYVAFSVEIVIDDFLRNLTVDDF